jgi:hypothetical protein
MCVCVCVCVRERERLELNKIFYTKLMLKYNIIYLHLAYQYEDTKSELCPNTIQKLIELQQTRDSLNCERMQKYQ